LVLHLAASVSAAVLEAMGMANKLRDLVAPDSLASVMSAHELAGFDGIWASGFELSATYGVPDASLLSFTQHLDMTRAIVERAITGDDYGDSL
jgi:2-methylisocitrate lyase-like PEP mutase family enzyme